MRSVMLAIIDFFYPPFRKWVPVQTFRYLACGGGVTVLGLLAFFVAYNFLLPPYLRPTLIDGRVQPMLLVGKLRITQYIAAYIISFLAGFPIGFFLSKFVVFQESHLKGRVQLFRYATLQLLNIGFNYYLLHFFAGFCGFWATPSQTMTSAILAVFSYFFQRYISFRSKKDPEIVGMPAIEEEKAD
ncbi:MAG: GtrA family protein [Edaphocola sp.]